VWEMSGIIPTFYVGLTCKDNPKFGRKLAQQIFVFQRHATGEGQRKKVGCTAEDNCSSSW